jgi:DNA-directed RNA polymerase specialized sigma24 family protein
MTRDGVPQQSDRDRWTLTASAFEELLRTLDRDRDRAATTYEQLRHRVIGLLRWWGAARPEELADATLDRVARKLEEGASVPAGTVGAYIRGVARMVFHESRREPLTVPVLSELPAPLLPADGEQASRCLEHCLGALGRADRSLLLRYYDSGKAADVRKLLAEELGLSRTALRIRAHRLRLPIERCVTQCLTENHQR